MQQELKFQKELVWSATKADCLSEIITHRFKKGWPDVLIKPRGLPPIFPECKFEEKRKTLDHVPVDATELQRHCLERMRSFGMCVFISVKVTIDKKHHRVYHVYDLGDRHLDLNLPYFEPIGSEKGKLIWPIRAMIDEALVRG